MNAILTPAKSEIVTKFNLECSGKVVGYIELNEQRVGSRYHIIIDASEHEGGGLYQGHGETPDLAIKNLLERHERYATSQLRRISELRDLLLSD